MKNINSQKVRSFLERGTKAFAFTSVLLAIVGCSPNKTDTDNSSSGMEMVTECTVSTTTSTPVTSTTTQSTTTNTTTTVVTTESTMMNTQITTTVQENIVRIESNECEYGDENEYDNTIEEIEPTPIIESYLPITEYERILLCNIVANEAGSDWISIYDKACVVACVMNRVNSASFPNSIEGVLTQPYQFSGYYASSYYYPTVTDACVQAVDYYFSHVNEFGSWLYFEGNGTNNYFH